jgi:hypothetical protein
VVAFTGIWMTFGYDLPAHDHGVLSWLRLFFGSAMALSILLGLAAALRKSFTSHRAWMVRGYAIGLGAGTQAFAHAPYLLVTGHQPGADTRAGLMLAGWLINLAVAEWYLRRPARTAAPRPARRPPIAVG